MVSCPTSKNFLISLYMLDLSSSVKISGLLPDSLNLDGILNRNKLADIAQTIYDTNPNLVAQLKTDTSPVVVKWFGWRHPIHRLLSPIFLSRAQVSWTTAQALLNASALTPKPIFVYTKRHKGIIHENIFITEAIHPHKTMRKFLKSDEKFTFFQTAITNLAISIARMHNAGIFHRDLTTGNFLVNNSGEVFIVDLNRAKIFHKLSPHHRLSDLAKINIKTNDESVKRLLEELFFNIYKKETGIEFDWIAGYKEYQNVLLTGRRRKKQLRSLFR
ncbi:MAG: hypothetical protein IID16_00495 [Candidatus Marinimicrobia bacterium]|nr:hypothetical protein [Candidatus Neomarinimicrobiota bacterium]